MEKPKNGQIKHPFLTKQEKVYRKKVEKICPACSGQMKEEVKYEFKGKAPYKKIEKKNGKIIYSVLLHENGRNIGFAYKYEDIPDEYTKKIWYKCQKCSEEFSLEFLTEKYFLSQGIAVDKTRSSNIILWICGVIVALAVVTGIGIGGEAGVYFVTGVVLNLSVGLAIRKRRRKKIK